MLCIDLFSNVIPLPEEKKSCEYEMNCLSSCSRIKEEPIWECVLLQAFPLIICEVAMSKQHEKTLFYFKAGNLCMFTGFLDP